MPVSFIGVLAYITLTFTGMLIARRRLQVSYTDCIAVLVECMHGGLVWVITLCLPNDAHPTILGIAA